MPVPEGSHLGPYTIVGPLGAGGMGEVYRARDTRLGRDVAIKILPSSSSADGDRLQRFEQEARAAASLNHPNILALYDIGRGDVGPYLVTELLDGDTLRETLTRGALPLRKAIELAVQVARGLAAAHEKGIVHRDLKPENVFVTRDGHAKILDFGLAKLAEPSAAEAGASMLPTTPPATTPGLVLGTVGYMAPEQVRGSQVDHRADIFAFGALLYEMLAGTRAFHRETAAETMTAILREEPPDLGSSGPSIPAGVQRVVTRCLEKNPTARFQSAGDLAFALDTVSSPSGVTAATPAVHSSQPARSGALAWKAIAVASVVALAAWVAWTYTRSAPIDDRLIRFSISTPDGWRTDMDSPSNDPPATVSPDSRSIVIRASDGQRSALWIRRLDSLDASLLPGTEGASAFMWSPDSRFIAFVAGGKLHRIDVSGGPSSPTVLADVPDAFNGGSWSRSGVILLGSSTGVKQVPATGGTLTTAMPLGEDEAFHSLPRFIEGTDRYLFVVGVGGAVRRGALRRVAVAALGSTARTILFDEDQYLTPIGVTNGHLLFVRGNTVFAQPFDNDRLTVFGEPISIVDRVQLLLNRPYGLASASAAGVLAYVPEIVTPEHELVWYDRAGAQTSAVAGRVNVSNVELSPDDKRAALALLDPVRHTRDIWLLDLVRAARTRFTFDAGEERTAVWSPDGQRVFYNAQRKDTERDLFVKASNGSDGETTVLADGLSKDPIITSPDGRFLIYRVSTKNRSDIWVLPLDGASKPYPFIETLAEDNYGRLSPDGRWFAYTSDESGREEVFVVPFPGPGGKWQVSTDGGSKPRWRGDGRELFYPAPDGKMMSVAVDGTTAGFRADVPRPLFQSTIVLDPGYHYDVTADGQRFLVNTAPPSPVPVTVLSDWTLLLKK